MGDVGWSAWEEINRVVDPSDAGADNLGWPCYEGVGRQSGYDGANLNLCETLYTPGDTAVVPPYFTYSHSAKVVAGESCPSGSSSISGLGFYESGAFPNSYDGALFFSDFSRGCIWSMLPGANGLPNPSTIQTFVAGALGPVDLEIHQGDLYYANLDGTIQRVRHVAGNQAPTAVATATPSNGPAPLTVQLSASGSSDPDDAFNTLELRLGRRRRRPVRRRQRGHPEPHLPGGQPRRVRQGHRPRRSLGHRLGHDPGEQHPARRADQCPHGEHDLGGRRSH